MKILRYPIDCKESPIAAMIRMHKDNCCKKRSGVDPIPHP